MNSNRGSFPFPTAADFTEKRSEIHRHAEVHCHDGVVLVQANPEKNSEVHRHDGAALT